MERNDSQSQVIDLGDVLELTKGSAVPLNEDTEGGGFKIGVGISAED